MMIQQQRGIGDGGAAAAYSESGHRCREDTAMLALSQPRAKRYRGPEQPEY
jgi:hypothetical protein